MKSGVIALLRRLLCMKRWVIQASSWGDVKQNVPHSFGGVREDIQAPEPNPLHSFRERTSAELCILFNKQPTVLCISAYIPLIIIFNITIAPPWPQRLNLRDFSPSVSWWRAHHRQEECFSMKLVSLLSLVVTRMLHFQTQSWVIKGD